MKKKVFLAIIPAILALTSCAGVGQKAKERLFVEDTLAHEEIFGNADISFGKEKQANPGIQIRKLDDVVNHPDGTAAIGVQSTSESSGHISFRFVAPVTFTEENITPTVATWTRTVSKRDGSAYPKDTGNVGSSAAYKKITNGGSEYSIADYNSANGTSYTHFVVYTLRNVPVDENDYFVSAYLNLSGEGGVSLTTKAIAVNAAQTLRYAYVHDLGVSFLDGSFGVKDATFIRDDLGDGNKAEFEGKDLAKNDTFVIAEFYNTKLYIKNASDFGGHSSYYFENVDGKIKVKFAGTYNLYLTNGNEIHTEASNLIRPLYVSLADSSVSWWEGSGVFTALYAYVNGGAAKWYTLKSLGDHLYVTEEEVDTSTYDRAIIGRIDVSIKGDASSTWWDSGKVYNQTQGGTDAPLIPTDSTHDHAYVKRNSEYEPLYISWWD